MEEVIINQESGLQQKLKSLSDIFELENAKPNPDVIGFTIKNIYSNFTQAVENIDNPEVFNEYFLRLKDNNNYLAEKYRGTNRGYIEKLEDAIKLLAPYTPEAKQKALVDNYLQAHPERGELYEKLKSELKEEFPTSFKSVAEGLRVFNDETKRLAIEWKNNLD